MELKRSVAIILVCASFMLGLLWRYGRVANLSMLAIAAGFITISVFIMTRQAWVAAMIGISLLCGFWRADAYFHDLETFQNLYGQKVIATGIITDDPAVSAKGYLQFTMSLAALNNRPASGLVAVRTYNQKLRRGYRLTATSKFEAPLGNKVGELVFATTHVDSARLNLLEQWRQRFFAGMRNALPEPQASFALGLILGTRAVIPKAVQDVLTIVGLTHLIAVSGYNLTILTNAARRPLRSVSKFASLAFPLWLIFGFMLLTGFGASIVRAAIVSALTLLATYYGRSFKPMVLIALSAVMTLTYNPAYLWSDVGWQLSFLAFVGILVLAPILQARWRLKNPLVKLGVESLSAYILTLPLIMAVFGRASIIAPLANLLILPLVPLAMFLSFVAGLVGMTSSLATLIALPLRLLLTLIFAIMNNLASLPWASATATISPQLAIVAYILLALLIATLHFQQRRRSFVLT